jgi:cyclase
LLTSIDADGTRSGYDLELTGAVAAAVDVPVIASGGAGNARHVAAALEVAQAALLASILHEDPERLTSLRGELRELGVPVRWS